MKPPRSNPNGVVQQSPGLARGQPWVIVRRCPSTPTGLRRGGRKTSRLRSPPATTPLGLMAPPSPLPRVVPSVQPWAWLHNRVAVEATYYLSSRPLSLTRMSEATTEPWSLSAKWHLPPEGGVPSGSAGHEASGPGAWCFSAAGRFPFRSVRGTFPWFRGRRNKRTRSPLRRWPNRARMFCRRRWRVRGAGR